MKTAISIPDATFERAAHQAQALGISRSAFFTQAATRYLDELDAASVTHQIDAALASTHDDESNLDAVAAGRRQMRGGANEEW